jgi:hypothetical protein
MMTEEHPEEEILFSAFSQMAFGFNSFLFIAAKLELKLKY